MSAPAMKEPTTRAGVLATGLVRIVATPEELTARRGWWTWSEYHENGSRFVEPTPQDVVRRIMRAALRTAVPKWLQPWEGMAGIRRKVRAEFAATDRRNADADREYRGGNPYTVPAMMTVAQRRAELDKQYRRLSGQDRSYFANPDERVRYELEEATA